LPDTARGPTFLLWLLERRVFNDPELRKQLVAAYVIGWSVTVDDIKAYPQLEMCESFDETGCIVSYNTQEKDPEISIVRNNAIGVNPLLVEYFGRSRAKRAEPGCRVSH
jgi:hypothetical protein